MPRWIQHPKTLDLIPADEYCAPEGIGAFMIMSDRHYDGLRATDGTPIDTRVRHRRYMSERGLTTIDDFSFPAERPKPQGIKQDLIETMKRKGYL